VQIPKAQKRLTAFFALLGSESVKDAHKLLVESTSGVNFINVLLKAFMLIDPKSVQKD